MDKRPIGMFDSGVGGLTVLKEFRKKLPNEKIIYLGDTKRFPYGSKSKEAILEISKKCVDFLISKNVKMIIIACGTATSQALDSLINSYDIPILGIINPTVEYISNLNLEKPRVGVIATSGTIKSGAWEKKILEKIPEAKVINEKAPLLATMAETGWTSNKVAEYTIKEYMKCFKDIDILILGCTHYPMFENLIHKNLEKNVKVLNTGTILAQYTKKIIETKKMENIETSGQFEIYLTDIEADTDFLNIAEQFLGGKNINIKEANF